MAVGLAQYLLLRRSTLGEAGQGVPNPLSRQGKVRYGLAALDVVVLVVLLTVTGVITAGTRSPPSWRRGRPTRR